MHEQVMQFVRAVVEREKLDQVDTLRVIDIGGQKVSSGRYYTGPIPFDLFPEAAEYLVTDIQKGPDVDIVMDATQPPFWYLQDEFDVAICTEVLEHVRAWGKVLDTCYQVLKPGGLLIMTCAGPGRPPHPATSEELVVPEGEWYENVDHMDVRACLLTIGFRDVLTHQVGYDTQAVARR